MLCMAALPMLYPNVPGRSVRKAGDGESGQAWALYKVGMEIGFNSQTSSLDPHARFSLRLFHYYFIYP